MYNDVKKHVGLEGSKTYPKQHMRDADFSVCSRPSVGPLTDFCRDFKVWCLGPKAAARPIAMISQTRSGPDMYRKSYHQYAG